MELKYINGLKSHHKYLSWPFKMDQKVIKWNFKSLNGPISLKIDLKGPEFTQKSQIGPKDLTMDQKVSK